MTKKDINIKPKNLANKFYFYLFVFTASSCVIGYGYYYVNNGGYPLLSFMTSKIGRFDDFFNSLYSEEDTTLENKAGGTVWPGSVLIYKILSFENIDLALFLYLIISSLIFFYGIGKLSNSYFIPLLALISYPYSFSIARGNNEHILVGIAALGYFWLRKKKENKYFKYSFIQQLIEPYPVYILQIIQFQKRNIQRQLGIISFCIVSVLLLKILEVPGKYWSNLISEGSGGVSSAWPGSTLHSSSLSSLVQFVYYIKNGEFPYTLNTFLLFQKISLPISLLLCIFFMHKHRARMDLQTSSLFLISIWTLFHSTSFDYRLLHFFIPISLMYYSGVKHFDKFYLILIAFLMIPKPYLWITAPNNSAGITMGSIVNPVILIVIIVLIVMRVYWFKSPEKLKKEI